MCPSGSISEKHLTQFPWVRSYVKKNGHLFLVTMADGSIIEFQPQTSLVTATVRGEKIHSSEADEMKAAFKNPPWEEPAE